MAKQPTLILSDLLDRLLDDHIAREGAYRIELERRTDAYKSQFEKYKQAITEKQAEDERQGKNEDEKAKLREPEPYCVAFEMAAKWVEQDSENRMDPPWEDTPFQTAVQVLLGEHHLTIVDDSGSLDIDGGNPAEEQVRAWLLDRRRGALAGTTTFEDEFKRLDTPEVVESVLRHLRGKYPGNAGRATGKKQGAGGRHRKWEDLDAVIEEVNPDLSRSKEWIKLIIAAYRKKYKSRGEDHLKTVTEGVVEQQIRTLKRKKSPNYRFIGVKTGVKTPGV